MKKNIIYCTLFVLAALLSGCQKESANQTGLVDYVALKLIGDKTMILAVNDSFVDPGFTATDKGTDVHDKVVSYIIDMLGEEVDAVDTSAPGIFTIYYTATSQDNVTYTTSRMVMVYDPALTASIEGDWAVDFSKSERLNDGNDATWADWSELYTSDAWQYSAYSLTKYNLSFTEIVPGIYEVNDLLGGFYTALRGYGPMMAEDNGDEYYDYYSMGGMVLLNADLSLSLISSSIPAWGDSLEDFAGTYDDTNEVLEIHSIYGNGMDFHIVMNKKD